MQLNKEEIYKISDDFLKLTKQYKSIQEIEQENYEISCIFFNGSITLPYDILVYAEYGDDFISFNPLEDIGLVQSSYSFHFDSEVFRLLEKNYQILSMTDECHYNIWTMLGEYRNEKVIHKQGFRRYVEYCKNNEITKQYLQENTSYDGVDITSLYHQKMRKINNYKER